MRIGEELKNRKVQRAKLRTLTWQEQKCGKGRKDVKSEDLQIVGEWPS